MEFLKSAVASAIAKGPPFPYTFGDRVNLDPSIWTLYNGTKREDGSACSIFSFDATANRSALPLAKNALKKLRTLRHPGVIKVLDTAETDSYIYIATERLVPLRWHVKRKSLSPETIKWGLYTIAKTMKFVNGDASSIHGNLKVASVYTSESGEWKLGGFELLSNVKDDDAVFYTYGSLLPDSSRYMPPELASSGWDAAKKSPHSAVDSYAYGVLVFEVFNGSFMGSDQVGQTKGVPPSMHSSYKRLVNANPKARPSVAHFLEQGMRKGAFFDSPLIKLTDGVDNLGVKSEEERAAFLEDLDEVTDDFPEDFFKMKILPELLKSVEFGGGGPKAFDVVMKIATKLTNDDFDAKVTPVVIRLFGNPDRAIRVCLLDNLPLMIDRLSQKVVNDKIFPQIVSGFTDVAPVVREQTLKSVLTLISKLSDRTINGELLRYLAKTANDEQPGIRTNTTICLGKIAKNLGTSSRSKVLLAAFTRSLRDPFVHARNAALMALAVTGDYFTEEDCAARIMPTVCPLLIDKEKLVRDQAIKTLDIYMQKVKKAAGGMPDTALPPPSSSSAENGPRMSTPQPAEASSLSAASWTGWAISSFTNKLSAAAGEIQSNNGAVTPTTATAPSSRPTSARPHLGPSSSSSSSAPTQPHRQSTLKPSQAPSLSRTSSAGKMGGESFFAEDDPAAVDNDDDVDAWGDMDDHGGDDYGFLDDGNANGNENGNGGLTPRTMSPSQPPSLANSITALPPKQRSISSGTASGSAVPFDDGAEPDFAGWLAAQAQKKSPLGSSGGGAGGAKALPKGLAPKSSLSTITSKKPVVAKPKAAPASAPAKKKLDMRPKETDDDDGWDNGW